MQEQHERLPRLDVWYVCDLSLCNFDCAYCASGVPEKGGLRTRKDLWLGADGEARLHRILQWIASLPYDVGLRLQTTGEPFVSDVFLAAAARMTRAPHVRFVELVTNGSLLTHRLRPMIDTHGADPSKLSLWITYHPTEISAEALVENARHAQERGAFVVVNALLFPDSIAPIARMRELCARHGLRTNVDLGQNFNNAYDGPSDETPLPNERDTAAWRELVTNRAMALTSLIAASPKGLGCSAGHDYIFVHPGGDVYACLGYARYRGETKLGSAFTPGFVPALRRERFAPCEIEGGCVCKEDFLHLEFAAQGPKRDHSLGYWPPAPSGEPPRPLLAPSLLERLEGRPTRRVLAVLQ